MKHTLLVLCIAACLFSCERPLSYKCDHAYINVVNNSSSAVYIVNYTEGIDPAAAGKGQRNDPNWYLVGSNHSNDLAIRQACLGTDAFKANDTSIKQTYFLFDSATIYRTPTSWDSATAHNLYLRKYTLNYHDIDNMGWQLVYP